LSEVFVSGAAVAVDSYFNYSKISQSLLM
jgi:hypothetical protein